MAEVGTPRSAMIAFCTLPASLEGSHQSDICQRTATVSGRMIEHCSRDTAPWVATKSTTTPTTPMIAWNSCFRQRSGHSPVQVAREGQRLAHTRQAQSQHRRTHKPEWRRTSRGIRRHASEGERSSGQVGAGLAYKRTVLRPRQALPSCMTPPCSIPMQSGHRSPPPF